jgi:acetamidase/formamidase
MPRTHVVKKDTFHYKWSKSHKPVLNIKPGDRVHFEINEVLSGQISEKSTAQDLVKLDDSKLYPLAGPVYVEGAKPGDALVVNIESVDPASWGWTGISPGLGLLEEFTKAEIFIWNLRAKRYAKFVNNIRVPLNPFCGVLGVAPQEEGYFDVMPPGRHAGNLDIRHLVAGSQLLIPIWNEGALFSVGDEHAAQGDGEVCVSAIECPGEVTLSFDLKKGAHLESPCYYSKPLFGAPTKSGYFGTTGIAPDLMQATKQSVRNMINYLSEILGLTREQAYMLCSVAAELRIHEIVDQPNWVVGTMISRDLIREKTPARSPRRK